MKASGKIVAQLQSTLHDLCDKAQASFPDLATASGQVATASGQVGPNLKSAYDECKKLEDWCYYYTCMYVSLTLLRNPAATQVESSTHQMLAGLVDSMGAVPDRPKIFADELMAMRKLVTYIIYTWECQHPGHIQKH